MTSYLKFLSRHRLFTIINMTGLCLSIAFLLLLGDLLYRQTTIENYQTQADRTYAIGNEEYTAAHFRIGMRLQDKFPEVESWCSVAGYYLNFTADGKEVNVKGLVTSQNFFEFFDYRLISGNKSQVLSAPNQIVVSRKMAERVWPGESPLGKELAMPLDNETITYTVSGVMEDFDRSLIPSDMEFVVNNEILKTIHPWAYGENMSNAASCMVFLREREGCDLPSKIPEIYTELKSFFWIYEIDAVKEVRLTRFSDLYYEGIDCFINDSHLNHGNKAMTILYWIIALLVLLFAIFNYVNLSVTLTTDRSKEMAMRRLLGLSRLQVFGSLIGESILFTSVAFIVGYLVALLLQDQAISLTDCPMDLLKDSGIEAIGWYILGIALTGLLAGFVPATVLSGYNPIDIVRGTFRRVAKQQWSHGLMVLQAIFAIVMLTVTLLLGQGIDRLMQRPLGYNIHNIMVQYINAKLSNEERQSLRTRLTELPEVKRVGYTYGIPLDMLENITCQAMDGSVVSLRVFIGDSTAYHIFGIEPEIIYNQQSEDCRGVGVCHQTLKQFGMKDNDVEFQMKGTDYKYTVNALYPDIVYQNVMNEEQHPTPFLFYRFEEFDDKSQIIQNRYGDPRQIIIEFDGDRNEVEEKCRNIIQEVTKREVGELGTLEEQHYEWYADYDRFRRVLAVFTIVALLIAVLGLMAMNSYFVRQRRREIAVRRVFGATISNITIQLLRTILLQSLAAAIIAIPLSYWLVPKVGDISGLKIEFAFAPLLFSLSIVLMVNLLTAALQSWNAATENPVTSIKNE